MRNGDRTKLYTRRTTTTTRPLCAPSFCFVKHMLMPEEQESEREKTNVLASWQRQTSNFHTPTHRNTHTHTHGRTDRRTGSLSDTCFAPLRTALHMFCPIDWRIYGLKLANTSFQFYESKDTGVFDSPCALPVRGSSVQPLLGAARHE